MARTAQEIQEDITRIENLIYGKGHQLMSLRLSTAHKGKQTSIKSLEREIDELKAQLAELKRELAAAKMSVSHIQG